MSNVVTRIAPSPTGNLHVGTARTALFNYLYARQHGGKFLIRMEDTDRERSKKEFESEILAGIEWLGLTADDTIRQSERIARHKELLSRVISSGRAYVSSEPSKLEPAKTVEVVRLKNSGKVVTFKDEIRGDISFDTSELKDFVIARSISDPLYHFAVVADDMDMGVTHVIRGDDHISNTPRQILIQEALGATRPVYVHLPLILNSDRTKMSKRSSATNVMSYKDEGILPEALINYLALLGWSSGDDKEDYSLDELIKLFDIDGIKKSGAVWDNEKLRSINQRWMRVLSDEAFSVHVGRKTSKKAVKLLKERARTFREARDLLDSELSCLSNMPRISAEGLLQKQPEDGGVGLVIAGLKAILELTESISDKATPDEIKATIMPFADAKESELKGGRGAILWALRYALSGQDKSPDPFTLISVLGRAESISRINNAIAILN